MKNQVPVLNGNQIILRCKLCGRKLKHYSTTGYGSVCYKKLKQDKYKILPLFNIKKSN